MQAINALRHRINQRPPNLLDTPHDAAVAAVLCPCDDDVQLLFIERMRAAGDPWSGHIAFPGGRIEPGDGSLRETAERETREEIDLHLSDEHYLGRLDDLKGTSLPVQVAAFVYAIDNRSDLAPNGEVHRAFWHPLHTLCAPDRQCLHVTQHGGVCRPMPAIDVLGPNNPLLWGITYRFTAQLADLLGHPLPIHTRAEESHL